jgi:hypothetical protein
MYVLYECMGIYVYAGMNGWFGVWVEKGGLFLHVPLGGLICMWEGPVPPYLHMYPLYIHTYINSICPHISSYLTCQAAIYDVMGTFPVPASNCRWQEHIQISYTSKLSVNAE